MPSPLQHLTQLHRARELTQASTAISVRSGPVLLSHFGWRFSPVRAKVLNRKAMLFRTRASGSRTTRPSGSWTGPTGRGTLSSSRRARLMIPPCSRARRKRSLAFGIWAVVRGMTEQARHQANRRNPGTIDRQLVGRKIADEVTVVDQGMSFNSVPRQPGHLLEVPRINAAEEELSRFLVRHFGNRLDSLGGMTGQLFRAGLPRRSHFGYR